MQRDLPSNNWHVVPFKKLLTENNFNFMNEAEHLHTRQKCALTAWNVITYPCPSYLFVRHKLQKQRSVVSGMDKYLHLT